MGRLGRENPGIIPAGVSSNPFGSPSGFELGVGADRDEATFTREVERGVLASELMRGVGIAKRFEILSEVGSGSSALGMKGLLRTVT